MQVMIPLAVGLAAGVVLGLGFFGGLWWTSRRIADHRHPALLVTGSMVVRLALLAVALVVLARLGAAALVGAVAGLLVARYGWLRVVTGERASPSPTGGTRSGRGR